MLLLYWNGAAALGIVDQLRRRFACLKLCAHFLDLRCLLIQTRRENFYSFPLLGDDRFLSGHCGKKSRQIQAHE